ncbi:membrane protein implicated in regulation of membrane protease activity [Actinoplanes campanulatus]|uniref:Membrane protein implicated in regulation of membrane protease activity n=1 Tax=Actinoplanes campanulatus TaxID=113559 RepID=A0A7W5ARR7_9ACTN|nr:membrane protein implicated in regulation of membrane protease activity [Actinoplanes campanulatus]GGN51298.1 hypothetical protein GCM10010109_91270 [Actinoplanes campanulatus]GID42120.1 hypothetical protein Aca09nite_86260 [Actinoplanes campanulatus]
MRQSLKDLALSDHSGWFGLGPLVLAALAGIRAFLADEPFARWTWTAVATLMLAICGVYVIWTSARREPEPAGREPQDDAEARRQGD